MAKTNESQKLIEKKLEYIGLNLEKIPKFLTEFEPLNFRPVQSYDEKTYKVYKHINVQDIQILITPTDRLTDLKERYKLASPLFTYLDEKNKENIEKFATFLKMLTDLKLEKIEELEEEQKELKEHLPTKVKYEHHFVWQIYYSDDTQKYFMLVPTNEIDNSAMFYLLKKQIAAKKTRRKETIFVPISHMEYSGEFLTKSEIADIENYLWYFTKEWASVYEVYDLKNKMSMKIVGNTKVYEKIKSDYVITLNNKKEATEFYKLLKAMFILATGAQAEYKFETKIAENGDLQFTYKDTIMKYENLVDFIKIEYLEKIEALKEEIKEKSKLEKRLRRFNNIVEELTREYLARQRQIATFLECKRTFFGRVKYFFKKKKDSPIVKKPEKIERGNDEKLDKEIESLYEEKEQYTIEDLINICTKLGEKRRENTNINLDIQAIENKKDILSKKIDNADLYLQEIDKHKKSIFEFWKFTSKDEVQTLNEGEEQEENKRDKIEKYFDYETDLEDLGKIVDELQRRKLSKNETDAIFAARQVIDSFRGLEKGNGENKKRDKEDVNDKTENDEEDKIDEKEQTKDNKVLAKDLKKLQEDYKNDLEYISMKDFDIFGNMSDDKTKIKTIRNEKHREIEKDKYKVLNINLETEAEAYRDSVQHYLSLIHEALHKIQTPYNMSIYKINTKKGIDGINIFNINPEKALEEAMQSQKENVILCKVNIKEGMPILYYSNIIFYDNFNKTLPTGMDLSSEVLVDLDKVKTEFIKEEEFNINVNKNEFEVSTKKIKLYEYNAEII